LTSPSWRRKAVADVNMDIFMRGVLGRAAANDEFVP
jgi:hypothetical protein